jgi:hypothetical protein
MINRCKKHQIFIGKNGCKICNEMDEISKHANNYHKWFMEELKKNDQLREENKKLLDQHHENIKAIEAFNELLKNELDTSKELYKENEHLKLCNDNNFYQYKKEEKRNKELKDKIEQLTSSEVPEAVKFATKYLTRNEKQIMINLLGAQSMLAVLVDHFNKIPENRKQAINPLYDYVINICEKVDYLNSEIAEHMAKQLSKKDFENTIADVANVCDFMAGKIIKCKTCTAWLDNKAKNRRM